MARLASRRRDCVGWQKQWRSSRRHKIAGPKPSCIAYAEIYCWLQADCVRPKIAITRRCPCRDEVALVLREPIYRWFKTAVRTPDIEEAQELSGRLQRAPDR